jgi:hypothetical protein
MSDRRPTARLAALLFALALVAAACGDDSGEGGASDDTAVPVPTESTTTTAPATDSPEGAQGAAAGLRADMTSLLQEHVYLVGLTVDQAVDDGGDVAAAGTQQAVAALDENSVDLANAIGSIYGLAAGEEFLELWQVHIDAFVDYTTAQAAGDAAGAAAAQEDLAESREDLGAFLEAANDELSQEEVGEELELHGETLTAAIDGFVADDPGAWTQLRTAARVIPDIALTLSAAIVEQQDIEGSVDSPGAELRAELTDLLQEHVYLAGAAVAETVEDGGDADAPGAAGALAALDENSVALSELIADLYGAEAGEEFLQLWRNHIGFFVDYAVATATGDADGAEAATENLAQFREDFGAFLESANELLTAEAVAAELAPHVETFSAAIDATVEGSPERFELLREAAQVMPLIARTLSTTMQLDL